MERSGEALEQKRQARDEVNERLKKRALETGWSVAKLVGQLEPRVQQKKKSRILHGRAGLKAMQLKVAAAKARAKAKAGQEKKIACAVSGGFAHFCFAIAV